MRGRAILSRFLTVGYLVLFSLLLIIIVSGCKKENDTFSKEALAFDLKEIPDSEVAWPEPPLPRALKFPGKVRKAEIEIEGNEYGIFLSPHPRTDICIFPKDRPMDYPLWEGAQQLNSMHVIGETYYRFATNSMGDKLFVHPYEGRLGTFEVGAGGRDIDVVTITGSLLSKDTAVPIGGRLEDGWPKPKHDCRVPEGDYLLGYSRVRLDCLQIHVSSNLHADGQDRNPPDYSRLYAIKIRENKSYIFNFSNKPELVFVTPTKGQRVQPGDELSVKAVLKDPKLDIMIQRLREERTEEYTTPDGKRGTKTRVGPINPKVIITRSDGERIVEGVMPFG